MKTLKRIISNKGIVLLTLIIAFALISTTASAQAEPLSDKIPKYNITWSVSGSGSTECYGYVETLSESWTGSALISSDGEILDGSEAMSGRSYLYAPPYNDQPAQWAENTWALIEPGIITQGNYIWIQEYEEDGKLYMYDPIAGSRTNNLTVETCQTQHFGFVGCWISYDWRTFEDFGFPGSLEADENNNMIFSTQSIGNTEYLHLGFHLPNCPYVPVEFVWDVTVEKLPEVEGCMLDVAPQYQNVGYYAWNCYDNVPDADGDGMCPINHIGAWGCTVTVYAMALSAAGFHTDTGVFHDFLVQNNLFKNDGTYEPIEAVRRFTNNALTFYLGYVSSQVSSGLAEEYLEKIVCQDKYPAIVGVNIGKRLPGAPGHYVLVIGREGDKWVINDPISPGRQFLDMYGGYIVLGYIAPLNLMWGQVQTFDSAVDLSELIIVADDIVELNVIDQDGHHTGYDLQQAEIVKDIPDSEYSYLSLQSRETQEWWPVGSKIVDILQPSIGRYFIRLEGLEMGHYNLYISSFNQDGSWAKPIVLMGVTDEGSTSTFDVQFDPTPNTPVSVARVATFESTLQDIENCRKLGMIDNDGIANSLRDCILDAAKKAERGKTKPCINILNEFKDHLEAQTLKHINEMATQILMEDADYLLLQLQ